MRYGSRCEDVGEGLHTLSSRLSHGGGVGLCLYLYLSRVRWP